jgi:hypothetical protein
MKSTITLLIVTSLLFAACATNKSVEAATSFAEKAHLDEETIIPGEGYANFVLEKTSQAEVEQALGKNYELIEHNSYSIELYYKALGVSFYFYQGEPERNVFSIHFHESFKGKTEEGIAPNTTTIENVIKIYGEPQWTSCDGCDYWSATYQGIGFIIDRDTTVPQYPMDEELHMKKIVKQIEVFVVY